MLGQTKTEFKSINRFHGLKLYWIGQVSTGKKDVLIDRIVQYTDESSLNVLSPKELYVLSETGKSFFRRIYGLWELVII